MSKSEDLCIPKPKCFSSPMIIPKIKLLGPGPTNMTPKVKKSLEHTLIGPIDPPFLKIMDDVKDGLQYLFQTSTPYVFCVPGSGHSGLEAVLSNLLEPGEVIVIGLNGFWGERAVEVSTRQGLKVELLQKPAGNVFSKEDIKNALELHKPTALFLIQVESSAGVLQDLEDIGHLCHRYGTFLIVDSIAAVPATPLLMDKWGIDVVYTATQKALNAPPGLAPMAVSANAMKKIMARKTKPTTYYLDCALIANYWGCDDDEIRYHHTCPVNIVYALRESLSDVTMKGLEWHWKRQIRVRDLFIEAVEKLGCKLFIENHDIRAPTVTAVVVPHGIFWRDVLRHMFDQHQIQILGGLGETFGKIFRIGFMGPNCEKKSVETCITAFRSTLQHFTNNSNEMTKTLEN